LKTIPVTKFDLERQVIAVPPLAAKNLLAQSDSFQDRHVA
jgi:hypothetical protein